MAMVGQEPPQDPDAREQGDQAEMNAISAGPRLKRKSKRNVKKSSRRRGRR